MTNVLDLNNNVFEIRGISRRARKAMATPLEVSTGLEITYDDCESVNGGGQIQLGVKFTVGGVVGFAVGALVSWGISNSINNVVYAGTSGCKEITLINIDTGMFGINISYHFDLGTLLGVVIGGGTGFGAAYALGSYHAALAM